MESGYEAEFVEHPSKIYECPVCLLVLREPYLLSCCGVKVCHRCIVRIQNASSSPAASAVCPLCRENFTAMMDKQLNRLILDLAVRCPSKDDGCDWVGELRQLNEHVDARNSSGCQYVEVPCGNACGGVYPRHALEQHEQQSCPKRPVQSGDRQIDKRVIELCELMHARIRQEYDQKIARLEETVRDLKREVTELKSVNARSEKHLVLNYSPELLALMPHLKAASELVYHPKDGCVEIMTSPAEKARVTNATYEKKLETSHSLKKDSIQLQPSISSMKIESIIVELRRRFHQCTFSYNPTLHSVEIASASLEEIDKAKEVLKGHIVFVSPSSKPAAIAVSNQQFVSPPRATNQSDQFCQQGNLSRLRASSLANSRQTSTDSSERRCALCLSPTIVNPVIIRCCSATVCQRCIDQSLRRSPYCPLCGMNIGAAPPTTTTTTTPTTPTTAATTPTTAAPTILNCLVCSNTTMVDAVSTSCCGRYFCRRCIDQALQLSPFCPNCNASLRPLTATEKTGATTEGGGTGRESTSSNSSSSSTAQQKTVKKTLEEKQQLLTSKIKKTFGYKEKQETEDFRSRTCSVCGLHFMPASYDDSMCDVCQMTHEA